MTKTRAKKGKEISKAGTGRGSINHDEKGNVVMGVSGTLTLFFFKKKRCTSSERKLACINFLFLFSTSQWSSKCSFGVPKMKNGNSVFMNFQYLQIHELSVPAQNGPGHVPVRPRLVSVHHFRKFINCELCFCETTVWMFTLSG